jgi:hypothetical protein
MPFLDIAEREVLMAVTRVRDYVKQDGTSVQSHLRQLPNAGGDGGIVAVLAIVLVLAALGTGNAAPPPAAPTVRAPTVVAKERSYVVQVASMRTRAGAQRIAARLRSDGWRKVGVLRSGDYHGLRAGYWVAYVGPFPATNQGKRAAWQAHRRLPDSVVRYIQRQ